MPSTTSGFSGTELVSYAQNWLGDSSSDTQTFLEQTLALAEFRYCKMHDWGFLNKQNLSLTVASGTDTYTLSAANIGFYMKASDVKRVYSTANNVYLVKKTLDELRLLDTDKNDGSSASELQFWAPLNDNQIVVWPGNAFSDTTLKIDGKVTPTALLTMSNYPTIPYHYQDSFLEYFLALALERGNDDRAGGKMAKALELIKQDIRADMSELANSGQPRFRSPFEEPGSVSQIEVDPLNMIRG